MKNQAPCKECPYKLGLVETVKNPCPECKLNDYKMFELFKSQAARCNPNPNRDVQKKH